MTETTSPIAKPSTPGRGLKIAFAVSLALNLAVAGLVAGAWLRHGGPGRGMPRDLGFGPFTEALNPDDRHALREAIRKELPAFLAGREAAKAEFGALLVALRAEPFDPATLDAALSAIVTRNAERLAKGQDLLGARLLALDPAARLAFADRLEAALARNPRD